MHLPTRMVRTAVVCLPADIEPPALPHRATAALTDRGLTTAGVLPHFVAGTRRASMLIDRWQGLTCGGPVKLLDLSAMRRNAAAAAAAEWLLWQHVVTGTKPANPFWWFADKHAADPGRYPLDRARAEYLAQPRVLAMTAYNALPHRICDLRTSALEAFQAGYGTYLNLAWLSAVPADGLAPERGGWLTPRSERLADQLAYLTAANAHLAQLHPDTHLVAVATDPDRAAASRRTAASKPADHPRGVRPVFACPSRPALPDPSPPPETTHVPGQHHRRSTTRA